MAKSDKFMPSEPVSKPILRQEIILPSYTKNHPCIGDGRHLPRLLSKVSFVAILRIYVYRLLH